MTGKKIVGKEKVDYINKQGNPVKGVRLYIVYEHENVEGMMTDNVFISIKNPMYEQVLSYPVGAEVNVYYNKYGSPESVLLCQTK